MYGQSNGNILFDNVVCRGTETTLAQCKHNGYNTHNCGNSEDVGVICKVGENILEVLTSTLDMNIEYCRHITVFVLCRNVLIMYVYKVDIPYDSAVVLFLIWRESASTPR